MSSKVKKSKELRAHEAAQADELKTWGWYRSPGGWRHRLLIYPWPMADAIQITKEALDMRQDLIHRILRGEDSAKEAG